MAVNNATGDITARDVPWALCCSIPIKYTITGTIMDPPPIPSNPLNILIKNPIISIMEYFTSFNEFGNCLYVFRIAPLLLFCLL